MKEEGEQCCVPPLQPLFSSGESRMESMGFSIAVPQQRPWRHDATKDLCCNDHPARVAKRRVRSVRVGLDPEGASSAETDPSICTGTREDPSAGLGADDGGRPKEQEVPSNHQNTATEQLSQLLRVLMSSLEGKTRSREGWTTTGGDEEFTSADIEAIFQEEETKSKKGKKDTKKTSNKKKKRDLSALSEQEAQNEDSWRYAINYALGMVTSSLNESLNNSQLKPFVEKRKQQKQCLPCQGTGMTVCAYCEGRGVVQLGKDELRKVKFRKAIALRPRKASGDKLYFCPFCGGLRKERCTSCLGTGLEPAPTTDDPSEDGSSTKQKKSPIGYIDDPSMGDVEITGKFGVRVWRRKKRPGRTPRKSKKEKQEEQEVVAEESGSGRKRRGRPRQKDRVELVLPLTPPGSPPPGPSLSSEESPPTDFMSTTSYRIQQELGRDESDEPDGEDSEPLK